MGVLTSVGKLSRSSKAYARALRPANVARRSRKLIGSSARQVKKVPNRTGRAVTLGALGSTASTVVGVGVLVFVASYLGLL